MIPKHFDGEIQKILARKELVSTNADCTNYTAVETVRLTAIIFPIPSQVNFVISLYYTIENVEKKSTIRYGLERLGKLQETILI